MKWAFVVLSALAITLATTPANAMRFLLEATYSDDVATTYISAPGATLSLIGRTPEYPSDDIPEGVGTGALHRINVYLDGSLRMRADLAGTASEVGPPSSFVILAAEESGQQGFFFWLTGFDGLVTSIAGGANNQRHVVPGTYFLDALYADGHDTGYLHANPFFPDDGVSSSVSASDFSSFKLTLSAPEPATWALMVAGFGLAGAGLRLERRRSVAA